jgi:hypothetical protein
MQGFSKKFGSKSGLNGSATLNDMPKVGYCMQQKGVVR